MPPDLPRFEAARKKAAGHLLAALNPEGHWEGHLSPSALSTATAITALAVYLRSGITGNFPPDHLIQVAQSGTSWLARHANPDGGWGDTTLSHSNIRTTLLCWAALGIVPGAKEKHAVTVQNAEAWIHKAAGGTTPECIVPALIQRYGKDKTFSVPILTMCALAGRLGNNGWKHVMPLPFELAACPHQWFATLKLPVVSYALPALIAIGQAGHYHNPTRNPLARWIRNATRNKTLRVLQEIQPASGGFLEATPLTSFVMMSLAGSGQASHPVVQQCLQFLLRSQQPDGNWPIDTNLATWVTTLSLVALQTPPSSQTASWLLDQQYRKEHPYTHAPPGGWAWTDLSGGVPDADDTSGALLSLHDAVPCNEAICAGITWLMGLQNRDGGIPTFCRGWGTLPFDRSSPDLTAHALRAWKIWQQELPASIKVESAMRRATQYLLDTQRPDGSWVPLWFGNQHVKDDENPLYGTARVLCALALLPSPATRSAIETGSQWLIKTQLPDGSWGGGTGSVASVEETALAVEALSSLLIHAPEYSSIHLRGCLLRGIDWLVQQVESGRWTQPSPIGFYFAKLWYYEELYPAIFTAGALNAAAPLLQAWPALP